MHGHIMFRQRYGQGYNIYIVLCEDNDMFSFPFKRQRALFNVLRAFSGFDKEVGYCQGMTNIAAMLLMYCEEEVRRFIVMIILHANAPDPSFSSI